MADRGLSGQQTLLDTRAQRGTHAQLLASSGLYASMWNRQREAEAARERLAQVDDDNDAPNRTPPPVDDPLATAAE